MVLLAVLLAGFASIAAAHTELTASIPAAKATVAAPVKQIVLEFGGDVRLTALVLTDAQGGNKKVAAVPATVTKKFTLAVEDDLKAGDVHRELARGGQPTRTWFRATFGSLCRQPLRCSGSHRRCSSPRIWLSSGYER